MRSRGFSDIFTVTPTNDTNAYSTGDVIGTVQEVVGAVLSKGGTGTLKSVTVLDKANQKSAVDIVLFDSEPGNSIGADNAAYALNDADLSKILGRISIAASDYVSSGSNNAEATNTDISLPLKAADGSRSIFVAVIARGTPTFGASGDLLVKLGVLQD